MKTYVFTILLIGWDIRNQQIFHSKVSKNNVYNPIMLFDASNHRKCQKVIQTGVQRGPQNPSKTCTARERKARCAQQAAATMYSLVLLSMSKVSQLFQFSF